jgi:hypothetical protein
MVGKTHLFFVVFSKGARNSNVPIPNIPPAILYVMAFE